MWHRVSQTGWAWQSGLLPQGWRWQSPQRRAQHHLSSLQFSGDTWCSRHCSKTLDGKAWWCSSQWWGRAGPLVKMEPSHTPEKKKTRGDISASKPKQNDLQQRPPRMTPSTGTWRPSAGSTLYSLSRASLHAPAFLLWSPLRREWHRPLNLSKNTAGGSGRARAGAFPLLYSILLKMKVQFIIITNTAQNLTMSHYAS